MNVNDKLGHWKISTSMTANGTKYTVALYWKSLPGKEAVRYSTDTMVLTDSMKRDRLSNMNKNGPIIFWQNTMRSKQGLHEKKYYEAEVICYKCVYSCWLFWFRNTQQFPSKEEFF